jgi:hypothetical protein
MLRRHRSDCRHRRSSSRDDRKPLTITYGHPEPELTRKVAVGPLPLPPGFSLNLTSPVLPLGAIARGQMLQFLSCTGARKDKATFDVSSSGLKGFGRYAKSLAMISRLPIVSSA